MSISGSVEAAVAVRVEEVKREIDARLPRGANALRNAELDVLNNPIPSSPGSPPGVRSSDLRRHWTPFTSGGGGNGQIGIMSGMGYAGYLENGTRKMAARPFVDKIKEAAMPEIESIFNEIGG